MFTTTLDENGNPIPELLDTPFDVEGLQAHLVGEHGMGDAYASVNRDLWTPGDWREAHETEHAENAEGLDHCHIGCGYCPGVASFLDLDGNPMCTMCHSLMSTGMEADVRPIAGWDAPGWTRG